MAVESNKKTGNGKEGAQFAKTVKIGGSTEP